MYIHLCKDLNNSNVLLKYKGRESQKNNSFVPNYVKLFGLRWLLFTRQRGDENTTV